MRSESKKGSASGAQCTIRGDPDKRPYIRASYILPGPTYLHPTSKVRKQPVLVASLIRVSRGDGQRILPKLPGFAGISGGRSQCKQSSDSQSGIYSV